MNSRMTRNLRYFGLVKRRNGLYDDVNSDYGNRGVVPGNTGLGGGRTNARWTQDIIDTLDKRMHDAGGMVTSQSSFGQDVKGAMLRKGAAT